MPQDPDTLIPDQTKFLTERERQRKQVHEMFASRKRNKQVNDLREFSTPDFPPRLQGDELVLWVRSGMAVQMAVAQHEALGQAALRQRGLSLEEWQIDPDGHILPRQSEPSSSGTIPPTETAEPTHHSDH